MKLYSVKQHCAHFEIFFFSNQSNEYYAPPGISFSDSINRWKKWASDTCRIIGPSLPSPDLNHDFNSHLLYKITTRRARWNFKIVNIGYLLHLPYINSRLQPWLSTCRPSLTYKDSGSVLTFRISRFCRWSKPNLGSPLSPYFRTAQLSIWKK